MSDERLRELERRWKETGSAEDEAQYLRERLRIGDLSQERLELTARLGYVPAAVICEGSDSEESHPLSTEIDARTALALLKSRRFFGRAKLVRHLEAWVLAGCPQEGRIRDHASLAWNRIGKRLGALGVPQWGRLELIGGLCHWLGAFVQQHEAVLDPDKVAAKELVPWLLGYFDPVRERVQARRREAAGERRGPKGCGAQ